MVVPFLLCWIRKKKCRNVFFSQVQKFETRETTGMSHAHENYSDEVHQEARGTRMRATGVLLGLFRLFPKHMDWMRLEKIVKIFDLFGIQTHLIPLNPYELRANRTNPYVVYENYSDQVHQEAMPLPWEKA
jgi:hypothetical protein